MIKNKKIDLVKAAEEIKIAFEELRTEKPGKITGTGSKSDVIIALQNEIKELINEGYTLNQISESINKTRVIEVLPRTISLALRKANKTDRTKTKKRVKKRAAVIVRVATTVEDQKEVLNQEDQNLETLFAPVDTYDILEKETQ